MTPWAYLPNAAHIDRVIATMEAMPLQYVMNWSAYNAAYHAVQEQRRNAIWTAAENATWAAILHRPRNMGQVPVWEVPRDTILALCAFDDCAYMLDSDPGELAILAKFGDPRAALLLPGCMEFHLTKPVA